MASEQVRQTTGMPGSPDVPAGDAQASPPGAPKAPQTPDSGSAAGPKGARPTPGGRWMRLVRWQAVAAVALAVLAAHFLDLIHLPLPFLETTGRIYVDSPEVYTRERLVNDRYDQDYWLRQRL
jgi:hypothetical protein